MRNSRDSGLGQYPETTGYGLREGRESPVYNSVNVWKVEVESNKCMK